MNETQQVYAYLLKLNKPFTTKEIAEKMPKINNMRRRISRLRTTGYIEVLKTNPNNKDFTYVLKGDIL